MQPQHPVQPAQVHQNAKSVQQSGNHRENSAAKLLDNTGHQGQTQHQSREENHRQSERHGQNTSRHSGGISGLLQRFLPPAVYDKNTKKIFGIIGAEDLLLLALIFLFMEKDDEENSLLVLALVFVLLSDFIDLSGFDLQDFGI